MSVYRHGTLIIADRLPVGLPGDRSAVFTFFELML